MLLEIISLLLLFAPNVHNKGVSHLARLPDYNRVYEATVQIINSFNLNLSKVIDIILIHPYHKYLLTNEIIERSAMKPFRIVRIDELYGNHKRFFNIFFIDGYAEFEKLEEYLNDDYFNFDGRFLFIVSDDVSDILDFSRRVFSYMYSIYILDVVILFEANNSTHVDVYTFFPYVPSKCHNSEPVLFNSFKGGRFQHTNFFPQKLKNFYGCQLTGVFIHSPPFMDTRVVNGYHVLYSGYEVFLIQTIAKILNFTLKTIIIDGNSASPLGVIFENGTQRGARGMLKRGEANFTIGWLTITNDRIASFLLPSTPYLSVKVVLIAPAPEPYGPIETLLLPFDSTTWTMVTLIVASSLLIVLLLKRFSKFWREFAIGRNNKTPVTNLISVWVNGYVPAFPKHTFARTLVAILIMSTIVLRSAYQGSIFQFLRVDKRHRAPLDFADYLRKGYKVHVSERLYEVVKDMPSSIHDYVVIHPGDDTDYFSKLSEPGFKGLILTSVDFYRYYQQQTAYKTDDVLLPQKQIQQSHHGFYKQWALCVLRTLSQQL
ncbi:unnamed protein product [Hermetia illucens]|uniref:Putative ionotropic receptor ligand binding domain-containing protein n=1 Tax=Hermetia illucens TaxID=343691 RepID=A0A7R8V196_HERIL|nr:unnamed protein product [Hermetia illucens]